MPTEAQIRKYVIMELDEMGYYYWYPARTKFKSQIDIFGVFDIIAFKGNYFKFIQYTTTPKHAARRKKFRILSGEQDLKVGQKCGRGIRRTSDLRLKKYLNQED